MVSCLDNVAGLTVELFPLFRIGGRSLLHVLMEAVMLVDTHQLRGLGTTLAGGVHLVQDVPR